MVNTNKDVALELKKRRKARSSLAHFMLFLRPNYITSEFFFSVCNEIDNFIADILKMKEYVEKFDHKTVQKMYENNELKIPKIILQAPPRSGKLLSDSTICRTLDGWKKHGDLTIGDTVFSPDGNPVKIIALSEVAIADLEVEFYDGSIIKCHENHEWMLFDRNNNKWDIFETKTLLKRVKNNGRSNFLLPLRKCLEFPEQKLLIDPYFLGVWLAHKNKHIPQIYLNSSKEQRLKLLAGLIDSNGNVCKKTGRVCFSNTNKNLIDNVYDLVMSLGFRAYIVGDTIGFNPDLPIPTVVPQKKIHRLDFAKRRIGIKSVRKTKEPEKGRCIQVSSEDGLYLAGKSLTPTHNTDMVSRYLPAYFLGKYPNFKVRALSGGIDLAVANNRDVQKIMMSDEYHTLFGNIINADRVVTRDNQPRRNMDMFEIIQDNEIKGSYSCNSVGGNIMGTGCNLLIVDDPISNDEMANSKAQKNKLEEWFLNTAMSRVEIPFGVIIMHQRWSYDDLAGRLLQGLQGFEWKSIKFKAIQDDGTSLIPQQLPLFRLEEARKTMPNFEAMYQQNPVKKGGNIIKTEYFQRYDILPLNPQKKYIVCDTAMKSGQHNDFSVISIWNYYKNGDYYLENIIRGKWNSPILLEKIRDSWNKYNPNTLFIEDKASGTGLIQFLRKERIPVVELKAIKDKYLRLQDVYPKIVSGFVYIPKNASWVQDFLSECEQFTDSNNHVHDDMVDCLSYSLSDQCIPKRTGLNINADLLDHIKF